MSKLGIYSSDDDNYQDDADKDERDSTTGGHEDHEQPSTGRTEAVLGSSNLAGMGATTASSGFFSKKAAMTKDVVGGRALELAPSYATAGYAGWSNFCLATSDGDQEEHDYSDSFKQEKEVSSR